MEVETNPQREREEFGKEKQKIKEILISLKGKDSDIDCYLDEVINCFDNDCKRATIILLWSVFLFFLYKKIGEFGFKEFGRFCKDKIKFEGLINQIYDMNKIKDKDILLVCRELGFYDINIENQLVNLLGLRNNCAHVSQAIITQYQLFSFIEQIVNYAGIINKLDFKKIPKSFFEELKVMEDEHRISEIVSSMEFEKLKNYAEQCLNEILFISHSDDYSKNKGLYLFLSLLIKVRKSDEEKIFFFEMIFPKVFNNEIPYESLFIENFGGYVSYSAIKKIILEKYLDNVVNLFIKSGSYKTATKLCRALLEFKKDLNSEQLKAIGNAYLSNNQLAPVPSVNAGLKIIFKENRERISKELIGTLKENGLELEE